MSVMRKVGEPLYIGAHASAEDGGFCTRSRGQHSTSRQIPLAGKFEAILDGKRYLGVFIPTDLPEGNMVKTLNAAVTQIFHSIAGSIGYMTTAFRPELSTDSSTLGRHFRSPTIGAAKKANATVVFAMTNRSVLRVRPGIHKLLVSSDSPGPGATGQGGRIFCGSDIEGSVLTSFMH